MTIAISIKINNGLVLATDSASSVGEFDENPAKIHHIYYNADKLFNLKKNYPIGLLTWGDGSINGVSISTLIKNFRNQLMDIEKIDVKNISGLFKSFLIDFIGDSQDINVGFLIAGYSDDSFNDSEMYCIEIKNSHIKDINLSDDDFSISWFGDYDFLSRFIFGIDSNVVDVLKNNGFDYNEINEIMDISKQELALPLGVPEMPIQDAIDLANFLVDICKKTSSFIPGPQTIGGDTDIAVITKHEGFKWIKRKHYYSQKLNIIN